jgi:hypothetical protein
LPTTALRYQQTYQHEKSKNQKYQIQGPQKAEVCMCQNKQDSRHASRFLSMEEKETNSMEHGLAAAPPFPLKNHVH